MVPRTILWGTPASQSNTFRVEIHSTGIIRGKLAIANQTTRTVNPLNPVNLPGKICPHTECIRWGIIFETSENCANSEPVRNLKDIILVVPEPAPALWPQGTRHRPLRLGFAVAWCCYFKVSCPSLLKAVITKLEYPNGMHLEGRCRKTKVSCA